MWDKLIDLINNIMFAQSQRHQHPYVEGHEDVRL
jgi:hypothetical protein